MTDEELLAAIAERVMGWREIVSRKVKYWIDIPVEIPKDYDYSQGCVIRQSNWNPLTDANDTLKVIEAMKVRGWYIFVDGMNRVVTIKEAFTGRDYYRETFAEWLLFSRAVCLAAAKAVAE